MTNMNKIAEEVERIGSEIAGPHAVDVDQTARFPIEALSALKKSKILSAGIPVDLGEGIGIIDSRK